MPDDKTAPSVCASASRPAPAAASARTLAIFLSLGAYFAYFSRDALSVRFAPDDMMNLATYWRMKPLQLLLAQAMPWRPFYRPMGGLVYLALFRACGLNPAPYHAVLLVVLFANVCLTYRLARLLGAGQAVSWLAALAVCYHAGIGNLYYNTAFIYDSLCCLFYLGAFTYYLAVRRSNRTPGFRDAAIALLLYLCALNSKEMAVTFPVMALAYEWLFRRPGLKGPGAWLRPPARVVLPAAILALIFCYGHILRRGGLLEMPAYRPAFTFARLLDFQARALADLLMQPRPLDPSDQAVFWVILTYLAFRRDRPILQFCWCFFAIAPLPIEFLPGRAGACLAVPVVALAIFAAVTAIDLSRAVSGFLARERAFSRLGRPSLFVLVVAFAVFVWARHNADLQTRYIRSSMHELGQPTWQAIQQFAALHPAVARNASVVFLNDPFDGFDMEFIAELLLRDRTVIVRLQRKFPVSPEEFARAQRVFDYREGRLVQLR